MSAPSVEVLVLSKNEVENLIGFKDARDAAEMAFRSCGKKDQLSQPLNSYLFIDPPTKSQLIIAMPSYLKSINVAGIKWASAYQNQKPGIPFIWGGLVVLNDPETGIPFAILEATSITSMRSAGGHAAVAAHYLAKKDSKNLTIIGCGTEGRTGLLSLNDLFHFKTVKIFDIKHDAMTMFQHEMSSNITAKILCFDSVEKACEDADIILVVTRATQPVLLEKMVPEGCFVAALRRFRDIDVNLSKRVAKWILGYRNSDSDFNVPDIGLSYDHVYADMGDIVNGIKPGRENEHERILYTHMGMGAHDVALGFIAYSRAKEKGLGKIVKLI